MLVFWVSLLLVVALVVLLAVVDLWATKHYFGRLRQGYAIEQAKLQAELRRIQRVRGNGKPEREPNIQGLAGDEPKPDHDG